MRDFEDSTLWRVSAFERLQREGREAYQRSGGPTLLPTTLQADLRRLHADPTSNDVLEVMAACVRHRESALLCLQHESLVWPVTLFPLSKLVHSPVDMVQDGSRAGLANLKLLSAEPPGVRPPGHWMHERIAAVSHYRPLAPLLWKVAMQGPRTGVLTEIGGRAAYRLVSSRAEERPAAAGALAPAIQRLEREAVSLRDLARWPGMDLERASRLLNALYLTGGLVVTRSHPAAREAPTRTGGFFSRRR